MIAILEGLYLGGMTDARDLRLLRDEGITHVINCAEELPNYHDGHLVYLNLSMKDPDPTFHQHIVPSRKFIDDARRTGSVLVHCYAGVSRSPSTILAYLCQHEKLTLEQAARRLAALVWTAPDDLFLFQIAQHLGEEIDVDRIDRLARILASRPR